MLAMSEQETETKKGIIGIRHDEDGNIQLKCYHCQNHIMWYDGEYLVRAYSPTDCKVAIRCRHCKTKNWLTHPPESE